jgi:hypothetical protein
MTWCAQPNIGRDAGDADFESIDDVKRRAHKDRGTRKGKKGKRMATEESLDSDNVESSDDDSSMVRN